MLKKIIEIYYFEQKRWFHWFVVFLLLGIFLFFLKKHDPNSKDIIIYSIALIAGIFLFFLKKLRLFSYVLIGISLGFLRIDYFIKNQNTKMLNKTIKNVSLMGQVEQIENIPYKTDEMRLILSNIKLDNDIIKEKIRLNIKSNLVKEIELNDVLKAKVNLYDIPIPNSLYAYNSKMHAYIQNIMASARTKHITIEKPKLKQTFDLFNTRQKITFFLINNIKKPYGAIAAALITGDRSYIPTQLRQNFIDSGLAHVLAISGLHLSIISALIFFLIRRTLSLIPYFALNLPIKNYAAIVTIFATFLYMAIANYAIPVKRSFIMISLIMLAIIVKRNALSMRSLVIAGIIIILHDPSNAISASFQLSFAAVVALIAFYESGLQNIQDKIINSIKMNLITKKFLIGFIAILITTTVATLATTPFSAYFFNRLTLQAILGNILAIPLVSFIVMPCALFSTIGFFINCYKIPLLLFEQSLKILCFIANFVSKLPAAAILVPSSTKMIFALFVSGFFILCLIRHKIRLIGFVPIILCFINWNNTDIKPVLYINNNASLLALFNNKKLYISQEKFNEYTINQYMQEFACKTKYALKESSILFKANNINILVINNPKDYFNIFNNINSNKQAINLIITLGYKKSIKKYIKNYQIPIIDRNDIIKNKGLSIVLNKNKEFEIIYFKDYYGLRIWNM